MRPTLLLCMCMIFCTQVLSFLHNGLKFPTLMKVRQSTLLHGGKRAPNELGMSKRQLFRSIRDRFNRAAEQPGFWEAPVDVVLYTKSNSDRRQIGECFYTQFLQLIMIKKGVTFKTELITPIDLPAWIRDEHNGTLPLFLFEGKYMTDIFEIAELLEIRYPNVTLIRNSTFTYKEVFEKTKKFYPTLVQYICNRDDAFDAHLQYELNKQLDLIDEILRSAPGKYICGLDLNMADYYMYAMMHTAFIGLKHFKGYEMASKKELKERPALENWYLKMYDDPVIKDKRGIIPWDTIVWGWRKLRGDVATPYKVTRNVKT